MRLCVEGGVVLTNSPLHNIGTVQCLDRVGYSRINIEVTLVTRMASLWKEIMAKQKEAMALAHCRLTEDLCLVMFHPPYLFEPGFYIT